MFTTSLGARALGDYLYCHKPFFRALAKILVSSSPSLIANWLCGGGQNSLEPPKVGEFSLQDSGKTMSSLKATL
jgi:hypothetical protein